jgi:serine/threonine-protein kinase
LAATQIGEGVQAPTPGNALPVGFAVGEYRVEGKLGEGGMATVYSARHPLIGKKAAIKVMSPALCADAIAVERFVQEARAVNQIGHPNIVDIFSFGKLSDGRSYFVMEWLQGETLQSRLAQGKMPLTEVIEILFHVCDALEAAHEKGIVHRDLKPENIFLVHVRANRKQVKLLDFGIAKLTGDGAGKVLSTSANVVMGTPQYISPEQARAKNIDHRTDIYSLGAMAYEMVLGRPPFISDSAMAMVAMHLSDPVPPPRSLWPEIPELVEQLLCGMLEKDADKRPNLVQIREYLADVRDQLRPQQPQQTLMYGESQPMPLIRLDQTPPPQPAPPASADGIGPKPVQTPQGLTPAEEAEAIVLVPSGERKRWFLVGGGVAVLLSLLAVVVLRSSTPKVAPPPVKAEPAPTLMLPPPTAPPAPAPAVAPQPAIVVVNTNVDGARIELDGKVVAESARNARLEVEGAGEHDLAVSATGKKPFKQHFTATPGAIIEMPITLRSASTSGGSRPARPKVKKDNGFYMLDPLGTTQVR